MPFNQKEQKIVSWNVNGLRACHKKGCWRWFERVQADIFCIQETKASSEQLPPEVSQPEGYFSFFSHSKSKKGYSGVAIFSKTKPEAVEEGLGVKKFDQEGRMLTVFYDNLALINVYFPNGGGGPARLKFKLDFYRQFLVYLEKLRKNEYSIIFCGDVNTAHQPIDLARPKENEKRTGFLPEERAWINKVIDNGYVDTFRYFHPERKNAYTYWDSKTFARDRNVGWRIDYFFVSKDLIPNLISQEIADEVLGSDHCPIILKIKI